MKNFVWVLGAVLGFSLFAGASEQKVISIGSDTMSHLMKITAEAYKAKNPDITIEVQDPGSSAGIGAMINGQSDLCPSSRSIKPEEIAEFGKKFDGAKPLEVRVALDLSLIHI